MFLKVDKKTVSFLAVFFCLFGKKHSLILPGSFLFIKKPMVLKFSFFFCLMAYQLFLGYLIPKPFS